MGGAQRNPSAAVVTMGFAYAQPILRLLPLPAFLEEDKGPDYDVLPASGVGGRGRVDTGRVKRPARDGTVGHRVIAFEH